MSLLLILRNSAVISQSQETRVWSKTPVVDDYLTWGKGRGPRHNPPRHPAMVECPLCGRDWPGEFMVEQRGVRICTRRTCLDS